MGKPDERQVLLSVWPDIQKQTIDYGVMEKARSASVIPAADLGWWDLGSWDRLFEVGRTDALGNLLLANDVRLADTRNTLIYQEPEIPERRLIATLGIDGLVIVDTGDVLLVCPRERTEDIRRLVEELERDGEEDLL
jgi:mannose-1-phosphate guanylyltransferase